MNQDSFRRRSFLSRLNAGAAAIAAAAFGGRAVAQVRSSATPFQAARHEQDNWMDAVPGQHRLVFDTTTSAGFGEAVLFASNYQLANRTGYGLENKDLAIIVIARHLSTGFGFNDAMWAKYGAPMLSSTGGTATTAPEANPQARMLNNLTAAGVHLAICSMATQRVAATIARATGGDAAQIREELMANTVANGHMVPAGIVAVSRAQERGYTLVTA